MNVLIIINGATAIPSFLKDITRGTELQPIDIDEVLEEDDIYELTEYINSLNAEHVYVLFSNSDSEIQSLKAIKDSTIKVDTFFNCFLIY